MSPPTADTPYQLSLTGLLFPTSQFVPFNLLRGAVAALLGHPALAVVMVLAGCAVDLVQQRLIRRWLSEAHRTDPARGFRKLSLLCLGRTAAQLALPLWLALHGGLAESAFFAVQALGILALACALGLLHRGIFWCLGAPVLLACAVFATVVLPPGQAAAVLLSELGLLFLMVLISRGSLKTAQDWQAAFNAQVAMVHDLAAARDLAVAERKAADAAREEARRATLAKADFLATMTHEIRTPMNGVLGMAQLLKREEKDPEQAKRLDVLIDSGEYLLAILNDVLDLSKMEAGQLKIVNGVEDLHLFLDRLVGFWGARAQEKGLALNLVLGEGLPDVVSMDSLRLRQVLFNLVGNALKFTPAGKVEVFAEGRPAGDGQVLLHLVVSDTGPGIPPEIQSTLFDRFSQGADAAHRAGGTGLGTAIAKQLTELMGGRIWVESEPGRGAAFHIDLPVALAASPAARPAPAPVQDEPELDRLAILAVDDNAVNLMVLDHLLGSQGHELVKAAKGTEALELLAARPFDLVLLDIQMPGLSGEEVLARLRASEGPNRDAPVVALTADVSSGGRQRYLDLGFTDHSTKPFQIQDLLEAIARALAAPRAAPAATARRA